MRILKSCLLWLLILWLLLCPSALSYPQLEITVYTDKPSYNPGERVEIYGEVTLDGARVENAMVALEVRDPSSSPIVTRTVETNSSGVYYAFFTLVSENLLGTYTVHVSCSHNGEEASNSSSFDVEHIPSLALTVETSSETCKPGETIIIFGNLTYDHSPIQGILVAVEVQDPNNTPIVVRVVETNIHGGYQLTFQVPTESKTGNYTVYATVGYEGQNALSITVFQLLPELVGDITGDGKVDMRDITVVAMAFGSKPGDPSWNEVADLNGDKVIDIRDLTIVALEFGKKV